jgi:hypothetical protein
MRRRKNSRRRAGPAAAAVLLIAAPAAGLLGRGWPDDFFAFPPLRHQPGGAADFVAWVFAVIAALCAGTGLFLVKPALFGFRGAEESPPAPPAPRERLPAWGWAGAGLTALFWLLAWTRPAWLGPLRPFTFFPLWTGFALLLDGLSVRRGGRSLIRGRALRYALLFPLSALSWWYFELLNRIVRNWWYEGNESFGPFTYVLYATLCFSTVLPAVLAARHLLATVPRLRRAYRNGPRLRWFDRDRSALWIAAGAVGLFLTARFPEPLFFLTWLAPLAVLAGALAAVDAPTPLRPLARGDASDFVVSALAALLCGACWELWNFYSLPKWHYDVPYVDVLHVFEMPLLGYAGYLPFGPACACFAALFGALLGDPDIGPASLEREAVR